MHVRIHRLGGGGCGGVGVMVAKWGCCQIEDGGDRTKQQRAHVNNGQLGEGEIWVPPSGHSGH